MNTVTSNLKLPPVFNKSQIEACARHRHLKETANRLYQEKKSLNLQIVAKEFDGQG